MVGGRDRALDALDLEEGVFSWKDPSGSRYRSSIRPVRALFSRGGYGFVVRQNSVLEQARCALRAAFGKEGPERFGQAEENRLKFVRIQVLNVEFR